MKHLTLSHEEREVVEQTRSHIGANANDMALLAIIDRFVGSHYTEADQRADTSFLTGVNYGRSDERATIERKLDHARACLREIATANNGYLSIREVNDMLRSI